MSDDAYAPYRTTGARPYPPRDIERVARALFQARPLRSPDAVGWSKMTADTRDAWYSLAIAALDMTYGVQSRV
jgi:hypothetical protein